MSDRDPVEIDGITGEVVEYTPQGKPARYRAKLDTLQDVKREMAKLYRESRSGVLDVQDATKMTWMLQAVGKVIEGSDLEKRIEVLEKRNESKK
ncbi:MAG: hypothetical protein ACXWAT_05805 [Methylobacter sp.]